VIPFLVPLLVVLVLISVFPQITLYLPTLWYRGG
jgi:TRAP-type C4-dicarboxylate transport system permease large subunit